MQTSAGHPLDLRDPANGPPCPMERLADRFMDAPKPSFLRVQVFRWCDGDVFFEIHGSLKTPDQLEDLINYLARVKG